MADRTGYCSPPVTKFPVKYCGLSMNTVNERQKKVLTSCVLQVWGLWIHCYWSVWLSDRPLGQPLYFVGIQDSRRIRTLLVQCSRNSLKANVNEHCVSMLYNVFCLFHNIALCFLSGPICPFVPTSSIQQKQYTFRYIFKFNVNIQKLPKNILLVK